MNSFTLLLVCVQALFIQYTFGQCADHYPAPIYSAPAPVYPAAVPACGGPYGLRVKGDALVIDGLAQITGTVPFASSVQLDGEVPAEGSASLRSACCCGDAVLH